MRALVLVPFLAACIEQDFKNADDEKAGGGPEISVSPTWLDFGSLDEGDEPVAKTFTVSSVGDETLTVEGITVRDETLGFTLLTEELAFSLDPGQSKDIDVLYTPAGGSASTAALVSSNDPDDPIVTVDLSGEGTVPALRIVPDPLDFGTVYVGCERENTVEIQSVGAGAVTVTGLSFSGEAMSLLTSLSTPFDLEPGESVLLELAFAPTDEITFESSLTVESTEPAGTRTGTQTGTGQFGATYEESWVIPENPPTDIMFIVDQSGSMDDDQAALAANFRAFINELALYSADWQIIVANNDEGCNTTGILTADTSGYETIFTSAVGEGGGTWITDTEALLVPAAAGVEATGAGECNDGFLREDALLHIILVSDEPEQSGDFWTGDSDWETYVAAIIAAKGEEYLTKISAVAGPLPDGCTSAGNSAEAGHGYYEAVEETGGVFLSICSEWSDNVEELAEASVNQDTYALENTPYEPTIVVYVNGEERTSGWEYDDDTNTIVFTENEPEGGDEVTVTYAGEVTCD